MEIKEKKRDNKKQLDTREDKKELILETVKDIILLRGYSNVSIKTITDECNISKGSFYTYFNSKEEMLGIIINDYRELILKILNRVVDKFNSLDEFLEYFVNYRLILKESELKLELVLINLRKNLEIIDENNMKKLISLNKIFFETLKKNLEKHLSLDKEELPKYTELILGMMRAFILSKFLENKKENIELKKLEEVKEMLNTDKNKKEMVFLLENIKKILRK